MPIELLSFSSCCEDATELCTSDDAENTEDDCCSDQACQCPCCHFTTFITMEEGAFAQMEINYNPALYNYEFRYSMDEFGSLFRPPLS